MKLYHGSINIIEKPKFGKGNKNNDYGLGFYCTENVDMAMEWAVGQDRDGFANAYELNGDGLKILNLCDDKYSILHWLGILLENRKFSSRYPIAEEAKEYIAANFSVDYGNADVIIGYRADDSYFSFAQDFINNAISVKQLARAMHLGDLGMQVVLKSRRAFDGLEFIGCEVAESRLWYPRKIARDQSARRGYFSERGRKRQTDDIYVMRIIDEGMTADDIGI